MACGKPQPPGTSDAGRYISSALILGGIALLVVGWFIVGPSPLPLVGSRLFSPPPTQAGPSPALATARRPAAEPTEEPTTWPPQEPVPQPTATRTLPVSTPAVFSPTRIVIPSIGVDARVVPTDWQMDEIGGTLQPVWSVPDPPIAGWHRGSAPLGLPGNTVISGHNWPENGVFRDLYRVEPGEWIILYSDERPFAYRVAEVLLLEEEGQPLEVRLANARYALPTDDERVTLVTCHPYGSLAYRLIVIARPAEPLPPDFSGE